MTDIQDATGRDSNVSTEQDSTTTDQHAGLEQDSTPTGFDALPEATKAEIRKLRRENADKTKRLTEFENANKSESEKLVADRDNATKRAEAAEQRTRDLLARSAVYDAAADANVPANGFKAVYALIRDDIDFDDEGEPTNIADLMKQARKDAPLLFPAAQGSGDGGKRSTNDGRSEFANPLDRLTYAYDTQSKSATRR